MRRPGEQDRPRRRPNRLRRQQRVVGTGHTVPVQVTPVTAVWGLGPCPPPSPPPKTSGSVLLSYTTRFGDPDPSASEFEHLPDLARKFGQQLPPPVRRVHLGVGTNRLHAIQWGVGDPELLYLHGAGLHAHAWDAVQLHLRRPGLALDLPGHGRSPWREDADYTPRTMAHAISSALDVTSNLVVVGHSLGGLTAIALSALRRELAKALVIIDTAPERDPQRLRNNPARALLAGPGSYTDYEELLEHAIRSGMGKDRETLLPGLQRNTRQRPDGRIEFKHHLASISPERRLQFDPRDLWPDLESLEMPVLLVYGDTGTLAEKDIHRLSSRVRRFSSLRLPAGHNVHRDQPAALARAIAAFTDNPD
ncbi:alpha/beta fold hydrolase [Pseudarthrobacter sp. GA104]|uniref:alpha/beta fold hydrolase n=1 Tax=Pseudarthrobacter sp. GA104 TaxID=2676311 RepID=UPI001E46C7D0|nr:alpha/beta hydrolase [Pseudarthrobacter sp. GA104]